MHGLPREHEGELSDWHEAKRHLDAIAGSGMPVRVDVVRDAEQPNHLYLEAVGKLIASGTGYAINTKMSRKEGGYLAIPQEDFRGGRLWTYDDDDYFTLVLELAEATIEVRDTNSM